MKKKIFTAAVMTMTIAFSQIAMGATLDYQGAVDKLNQESELVVNQNFADSKGNVGKLVIMVEPAYAQAATLSVKESPDADSATIVTLTF